MPECAGGPGERAGGGWGDGVGRGTGRAAAHELAALVRGGAVSAREVVLAHLDRVEAVNSDLNAIVTLRIEEALAEADLVDSAVAAGGDLPLAGVPFTVKDIIAASGVRTTAGTPFMGDFVPTSDATVVGRLRSAGAILLGKTNCPEFGMFRYTRNSLFGGTRNPLGPVTVGGSSGGEAAAIASGCSALGVGTDFGGSVRWPAHCTGILALRPTAGGPRAPDSSLVLRSWSRCSQRDHAPGAGAGRRVAGPRHR